MRKIYEVKEERELINDRFRLITGTVCLGVLCSAILSGKCERDKDYVQPKEKTIGRSSEYVNPENIK